MHSNQESLNMNIYELREIRRYKAGTLCPMFVHVWASGEKRSKQWEYVCVVISTCSE